MSVQFSPEAYPILLPQIYDVPCCCKNNYLIEDVFTQSPHQGQGMTQGQFLTGVQLV